MKSGFKYSFVRRLPRIFRLKGYPNFSKIIFEDGDINYDKSYGYKIFLYNTSLIIVGILEAEPGIRDFQKIFITRYDVSGSKIWEREFLPAFDDNFEIKAAVIDTDGNVYITGKRSEAVFLVKYSKDGEHTIFANHIRNVYVYDIVTDSEKVYLLTKENEGEKRISLKIYDCQSLDEISNEDELPVGTPFKILEADDNLYISYHITNSPKNIHILKLDKSGGIAEDPILFKNSEYGNSKEFGYCKLYIRRNKLYIAYKQRRNNDIDDDILIKYSEVETGNGISWFKIDNELASWDSIDPYLDSRYTIFPDNFYFFFHTNGNTSRLFKMIRGGSLEFRSVELAGRLPGYCGFNMTWGPRRFSIFRMPILVFFTGRDVVPGRRHMRPFFKINKLKDFHSL